MIIVITLIYIIPIVFVVWYLFYFLKLQKEKNNLLKTISDKLDNIKK